MMTTLCFFASLQKAVGARAGNFFGELEILEVFALAKVLRAEEFLRADDLRALPGGAFGEREGFLQVRFGIRGAGALNQPDGGQRGRRRVSSLKVWG